MKKLIKAPLDEKNICPTQIIDDLTNCNNIGEENTAVGYMYKTPVLFEYSDNIMRIRFRKGSDLTKHICDLRNYCNDIEKNTEGLVVHYAKSINAFEVRFYWEVEEEE